MPSRLLLSMFFVVHFGAVGTYVLPLEPLVQLTLPAEVSDDALAVLVPVRSRLLYPSMVYLSTFSLQQHWQLFAPEPIRWAGSLKVEAYYPTAEGVWRRQVTRPGGYPAAPIPRLGGHREWRVHSNLGYEGWGQTYGPIYARALCERIRDGRGRRPRGLTIAVEWEPVVSPWSEPTLGDSVYSQRIGGYDCPRAPRR